MRRLAHSNRDATKFDMCLGFPPCMVAIPAMTKQFSINYPTCYIQLQENDTYIIIYKSDLILPSR